MKKTGVASVATVIALNGFKTEVLASPSNSGCDEGVAGCPGGTSSRLICIGGTVHNMNSHNHAVSRNGYTIPATGGVWSPAQTNAGCPNGQHGG
jgi:hypothetical protein